ncbi:unnamed protein product [Musa acuminata subsp. burmannicoides]
MAMDQECSQKPPAEPPFVPHHRPPPPHRQAPASSRLGCHRRRPRPRRTSPPRITPRPPRLLRSRRGRVLHCSRRRLRQSPQPPRPSDVRLRLHNHGLYPPRPPLARPPTHLHRSPLILGRPSLLLQHGPARSGRSLRPSSSSPEILSRTVRGGWKRSRGYLIWRAT